MNKYNPPSNNIKSQQLLYSEGGQEEYNPPSNNIKSQLILCRDKFTF